MSVNFVSLSGAGGSTVLYGATSGNVIYRSTDAGSNWMAWKTASASFRPVDVRPVFRACPHSLGRLYAVNGNGYAVRFDGTSNPTETRIFDARNYVSGYPTYKVHDIAIDPFNPDLGYISLYMWGCGSVYRCTNLTTTTGAAGDWECIAVNDADGCPHVDLELNIHPLTSDLFATGSHGTFVCPPPAGHRSTYSIANSVWDRANAYFKTVQ